MLHNIFLKKVNIPVSLCLSRGRYFAERRNFCNFGTVFADIYTLENYRWN